MARHLVRLKLALLRSSMASAGIRGRIAIGVAYLFAVIVGALGGLGMAALRAAPADDFSDLVLLGFAVLFVLWSFGPVLTVASENTLEVDKLTLFPLSSQQLVPGLLLAGMAGFGGLATAFVIAGAFVGTAPVSPGAVLTLAAVLLEFAVCVAGSRLLSTVVSMATRKRRWRDLALTVVPLTFFAINLALHAYSPPRTPRAPGVSGAHHRAVPVGALRVLPSGPPATAAVAARQGRWLVAAAALAASAAVLLLMLRLWGMAVDRVMTTAVESGGGAARRGARQASLFPQWAGWLPRNRVGGVAAKELRLQWREPRRRSTIISSAFFGLLPLLSMRSAGGAGPGLVLVAVFPAVIFGLGALNLYGFDGPRFWMHVAAGDDARADLLGKNLETVLLGGIVTVFEALALAAVTGGWGYVVPTLGVAALAMGLLLGIGNRTSISIPVSMPDSASNVWASNSTQGIQTLGPVFGAMFATSIVVVPAALLTLRLHGHIGGLALLVAEALFGWGAWRLGLDRAVRRSTGRQAELLAALTRS